jgi:hypothetical protein
VPELLGVPDEADWGYRRYALSGNRVGEGLLVESSDGRVVVARIRRR